MQTYIKLLDDNIKKQIIENTNSDEIVKQMDYERFSNEKKFAEWLKKDRTLYALEDENKNVLGIIWFGQKTHPLLPEYKYTFGIRMYKKGRGRGLSLNFMKNTFNVFINTKQCNMDNNCGFWLETDCNNFVAKKLYRNFGFSEINNNNSHKTLMCYKNS